MKEVGCSILPENRYWERIAYRQAGSWAQRFSLQTNPKNFADPVKCLTDCRRPGPKSRSKDHDQYRPHRKAFNPVACRARAYRRYDLWALLLRTELSQ